MALTAREKTIIATTITGYISNIPVESSDDFSLLTEALQSVVNLGVGAQIDPKMQAGIATIQEYMEPWFGAVTPENREEFISFCHNIILNRIQYLERLSIPEKLEYVQDQSRYRQDVNERQARMSSVSPPEAGSEAHVISEIDMLRQIQAQLIPSDEAARQVWLQLVMRRIWIQLVSASFNGLMPEEHDMHDMMNRAYLNTYTPLAFFREGPRPYFYNAPIPRPPRIEPVIYGHWTRVADSWDAGDDQIPFERATHSNRERLYRNNQNIQCVYQISINGYTDGHFKLRVWVPRPTDTRLVRNTAIRRFSEALIANGINENTPHIAYVPGRLADDHLTVDVSIEDIDDILRRVFTAIEQVEGVGSINDEMKTEIHQSLMQFLSPALRL